MLGLTTLGAVHTAISLVAVAAGLIALIRDRRISPQNMVGKIYLWATILTAATGFGIFQHGGFGKPHLLGVATLAVLLAIAVTRRIPSLGGAARYVEAIGFSATFLFHLMAGTTESLTRLPLGRPLVASREDPVLLLAIGLLGAAFLVGAALQAWWLRSQPR